LDSDLQSQEALQSIPQADYVGYVRKLEKTLIAALMNLGVEAGQRSGLTGVWVKREQFAKIAAIGVKVDVRGVSRHGFALNVNPDMEYWKGILACGLLEPVVSLADLVDPVPSMKKVKEAVNTAFYEVFGVD
jgi:lipoate-protein ligase B